MISYANALEIVSKFNEGFCLAISDDWAQEIIKDFGLELKCGTGDMTGEKHALFEYKGIIIRLKKTWMRTYKLFRGEWKSDPHWTGD